MGDRKIIPIEINVKRFFKSRKPYQSGDWQPRCSLSLLLASVMFGIGLATCISYWIVRSLILDELQNSATLEVQRSRDEIDQWLAVLLSEVQGVANHPSVRSMDWKQAEPYLQLELDRLTDFHMFAMARTDGSYYTTKSGFAVGKNLRDRTHFQQAMAGKAQVDDPVVSKTTGIWQVNIAVPIWSSPPINRALSSERAALRLRNLAALNRSTKPALPPQPLGELVAPVAVERLSDVIERTTLGRGSYAFALDSKGTVIAHPNVTLTRQARNFLREPKGNLAAIAQQMVKHQQGVQLAEIGGEWVYVAYAPLHQANWSLALVIPRANLENRLIGLNGLAAVLGSLLVVVTMFALHQLHLLEQTRARAAKEALLNRISDRIRHSLLDLPAILQTTLKEVADLLEVDGTTFGWLRADIPALEVVHQHQRVPLVNLKQTLPLKTLGSLATYFLQHRPVQWVAIAQATDLNDTAQQMFYQLGIHSYLALPVVTHSRVGYLACIHTQPRYWSDGELELLNAVTDQLAIAIHQAYLYAETQKQVEALERLNKLKDDFLSTVSHELRSPISNIKLITQMIEQALERSQERTTDANPGSDVGQPALGPEVSRYFSILKDECQREMELINNLLDLTRLDAGTEPLFPSLINLSIWLPHVAEPFMGRVQSQQQQLHIDLPDPLPALETDADYLERILRELLQNACKYTPPEGTIILSAQAIANPAAVAPQSQILAISVTNTGVEIPPLEQTRIFDKFYRIPNGDPWRHGGTGLGLALAKRIAEYLGATLQVSSRDGRTCFTLQFTQGLQSAPPVPLSCDPLSQNLKSKA